MSVARSGKIFTQNLEQLANIELADLYQRALLVDMETAEYEAEAAKIMDRYSKLNQKGVESIYTHAIESEQKEAKERRESIRSIKDDPALLEIFKAEDLETKASAALNQNDLAFNKLQKDFIAKLLQLQKILLESKVEFANLPTISSSSLAAAMELKQLNLDLARQSTVIDKDTIDIVKGIDTNIARMKAYAAQCKSQGIRDQIAKDILASESRKSVLIDGNNECKRTVQLANTRFIEIGKIAAKMVSAIKSGIKSAKASGKLIIIEESKKEEAKKEPLKLSNHHASLHNRTNLGTASAAPSAPTTQMKVTA